VIEHLFNSVEVEIIANIILINFAKESMVFKTAEPIDPTHGRLRCA
jgi:hypothetical protein